MDDLRIYRNRLHIGEQKARAILSDGICKKKNVI